jgi:uncharacterized caspase-like protein
MRSVDAMDQPREGVSLSSRDPGGEAPLEMAPGRAGEPGYRRDAHAVIIGIDHYDDDRIPDLRCARADAEAVFQVLTDSALGRFHPDNVNLLVDEQATERAIRTVLGHTLPERAGRDDTVFVYYAGHGAPVIHPKGGSSDGLEKYLVPTDAELHNLRSTAIPMEAVQKFFGYIDSRQVLFFIDSCYSGVAGGRTFERPDYQARAPLTDEFLEHLGGEGRFVVTACDVNEVSLEATALGHGLFTYYLTEGLKGAADQRQTGFVSVHELYEYIHENVSKHARKLGGSMHPLQKGSVRGRVLLTQYETEPQRRGRALMAEAAAREQAGDLDKALDLWVQAMQLRPADQTARQSAERIQQRLEEEKLTRQERTHRLESSLYRSYEGGLLPLEEYKFAMGVVNKKPGELTEVERRLSHWIELLGDDKISPQIYLRSVEQARKQRASSRKAPESETPIRGADAHLAGPVPSETTAVSKGSTMSAEMAVLLPGEPSQQGPTQDTARDAATSGRPRALWTIFVIVLVLWVLGVVSSYTLGGFIHILLVVAIFLVMKLLFDKVRSL